MKTKPIISSLLDLDHYKLTMGQFAFHRYANIPVTYALTNRTKKVKLAEIVPEADLRYELDAIRELKPTDIEIDYLRGLKNNEGNLFTEDYLNFFRNVQLPDYRLEKKDGQFELEFEGPWARGIYWETLALSVVNELYYNALLKDANPEQLKRVHEEGKRRLEDKLVLLHENSETRFMEFGTRRRFSKDWQDYVVKRMKDAVPNQIAGTSNVLLAMKYNLKPIGTMAHETFMIMSGIMHGSDDEIRASHNQVLREWWNEYGHDLSVALTDTYGTKFFFEDMTKEQARNWKGMRQDSGNPRVFAQEEIKFYQQKEIDPLRKMFVPSDGLDVNKIINLQREFKGKILQLPGWGTNATNDLGLGALSLVVKAVEANGHGTVKLSDNPAKSIGKPEDIVRFRKIFNYNPANYQAEECVY